MRWSRVAVLVVPALVVVLVVLLGAAPARAADPVPPPVAEWPEVPSKSAAIRTSAGGIGDNVIMDLMRAMANKQAAAPAAAPLTQTPQPLTKPGAFVRGNAVLAALMAGWAIGANGALVLVGVAQGSNYQEAFCSQPEWYQGTTSFVNLSISPDCKAMVAEANADRTATEQLVYGGVTYTMYFWGTSAAGYSYYFIGSSSPTSPDGYQWVTSPATGVGTCTNICAGTWPVANPPAGVNYSNWYQRSGASPAGSKLLSFKIDPPGAPTWQSSVTMPKPDVTRTGSCTINWVDGTITTGTGMTYTESTGIPLTSQKWGCDTAWDAKPGRGTTAFPSKITTHSTDDAGAKTDISTQEVPNFGPDAKKSFTAEGNGHGLVLEKVIGTVATSCMTWAADCANWWPDTASGTNPTTGTRTYRCTYQGLSVALAECGVYRTTFDTQTSTPTITQPGTTTQTPWQTAPQTGTSPGTSTGGFPSTGTSPGTSVATVTGGGGCALAWSWNPVDWVLNPLRCAFIPSTASITAMQTTVATAWAPTMVGQLPGIVTAAFTPPDALEGCEGPHVYMDFAQFREGWVVVDWYPLNACDAPMSNVAELARTIGAGILIYLTALGIVRRIATIVNAPGLGSGA